jgi:eukaryotic-like serine/threonine-protein kinase
MRVCPACKSTFTGAEVKCTKCSTTLVDDEFAISLSETVRKSKSMGVVSPTPAPVRAKQTGETPTSGATTVPGAAAALATDPGTDSLIGSHLAGRYEVSRKIGEGGMGAVYEARHSLIGKRVAIKVLLEKYATKPDVVARLQQEARLASSIGHENIVDITDFGQTDDGRTFVVMEFLEGESLAQLLARVGPLAPQRAVAIARQVVSALGAAHGKAIVHRDVKPENVFIVRRGNKEFAKVVDFGISKLVRPQEEADADGSPRLTQTGMVLGTPLYMSPEQARGEDELDHRIDVYAVGVILYEIITGEVPYRGTNYLSIISQVLSQDPKRPSEIRPDLSISPALEAVILKAMAKDRDLRYKSMTELDADLARLETGAEVNALAGGFESSSRHGGIRPLDRNRLAMWALAIFVIIAAVAYVVTRNPARPPAPRQEPVASAQPAIAPAPPQPAEPTRPAIEKVTIMVTSDPAGAEVFRAGKSEGLTPVPLEVEKSKVPIELVLRKDGCVDTKQQFTPTKSQSLSVKLKRVTRKQGQKPGNAADAEKADDPDLGKPPTFSPPK